MFERRFTIGLPAVIALVVLRIAVGWHFYYEGHYKRAHNFSAEPYFRAAKGPFDYAFRQQVWDLDGRIRLRPEMLGGYWMQLLAEAGDYYGFTDAERQQAQRLAISKQSRMQEYLAEQDVDDYFRELVRLEEREVDARFRGVPFLDKRLYDKRVELDKRAKPWLDEADRATAELLNDLHAIAVRARLPEAAKQAPTIDLSQAPAVPRYSPPWTQMDLIDATTAWLLLIVGFCLMTGLFTRPAALAGAIFLAMVVAAMPALPNIYPPPHPSAGHALYINKEVLELLALVVLATLPVGRWGGLDFFVNHYITQPLRAKFQREGAPA